MPFTAFGCSNAKKTINLWLPCGLVIDGLSWRILSIGVIISATSSDVASDYGKGAMRDSP